MKSAIITNMCKLPVSPSKAKPSIPHLTYPRTPLWWLSLFYICRISLSFFLLLSHSFQHTLFYLKMFLLFNNFFLISQAPLMTHFHASLYRNLKTFIHSQSQSLLFALQLGFTSCQSTKAITK